MSKVMLVLVVVVWWAAVARGYLWEPATTHKSNADVILTNAEVDSAFMNATWNDTAVENTAAFNAALPMSSFKTLRDLADRLNFECSDIKLLNEPIDVRKMNSMTLKRNGTTHGPCEMWIGDERVFQDDDCFTEEKGRTKLYPIPFFTCHGVCAFSTYWLMLNKPEWQLRRICLTIATPENKTDEEGIGRRLMTMLPLTRDALGPWKDKLFEFQSNPSAWSFVDMFND